MRKDSAQKYKNSQYLNLETDLLPALKGEGSLRSQGLHPFTGATLLSPKPILREKSAPAPHALRVDQREASGKHLK